MVEAEFSELMARLRAGDEEAAAELFHRFASRLAGLASQHLGPLARGKVDPEDVVQSVFKSFFNRQARGLFAPEGWAGLWALLTAITLHKCGHKIAYLRAACRDVRRETSATPPAPDYANPAWKVIGQEPDPSQVAILAETIEQIHGELEDHHREIFRLALEGHSPADIAQQVDVTERTVQRVLKRIREKLEGLAADPDGM